MDKREEVKSSDNESPAAAPDESAFYRDIAESMLEKNARIDVLESEVRTLQEENEAMREERERLKAQLAPCGECHLRVGERCDICGKVRDA